MNRLFGKKAKKSLRPPRQNIAFGILTNIAAGPLGFRAELDIDSTGDSYQDLEVDWPDSTATLDEENPRPSQIVFKDKEREGQGPLAPGTSIPGVVVDSAERGSDPTNDASDPRYRSRPSCRSPHSSPPEEDIGNTREGEGEPAEASMGMCQYRRVTCPPLTPTRIQTARTQRLRMPSFPLILPKTL